MTGNAMEVFYVETKEIKRSKSRHCKLWCFVLVTLSLFAGFVAFFLSDYFTSDNTTEVSAKSYKADALQEICEDEVCTTKECITTAARILKTMDTNKNPCGDFYGYACGNYENYKAVRHGEEVYDLHNEAADNILINIKRLIGDREMAANNTANVQMAALLYHGCINETRRKQNVSNLFHEFLNEKNMPWPVLHENQIQENDSWSNTVGQMMSYGFETLFTPHYYPSGEGEERSVVIELDCKFPFLPANVLLDLNGRNSSLALAFYDNIVFYEIYKLGYTKENSRVLFQDIVQLEAEIARAYLQTENELGDDCITACTRSWCPDHCKKSTASENVILSNEHDQQLKDIWAGLLKIPAGRIEVKSMCKGNLEEVLRILNTRPKKSVLNYVRWIAVSHMAQYLSRDFQTLYSHYRGRLIDGPPLLHHKWRECSDVVRRHLGFAIAKDLEHNSDCFKELHQRELRKRFLKMKQAFVSIFQIIPWLDNTTASVLTQKLNAMALQVGHPSYVTSEMLDGLYRNLTMDSEGTYFSNIMKVREFNTALHFSKLVNHYEDDDVRSLSLEHTPLGTESSYNYLKNRVETDMGILVSPFFKFNEGSPGYLEYGQDIIMAREISHALDTKGINLDENGKAFDVGVISEEVRQKYLSFVQCLAVQLYQTYGSQPGPQEINDAIADLGSFFLTHVGLQMYLNTEHGNTFDSLPGLELDKHQIYFLQAAQMFCEARDFPRTDADNRAKRLTVNGAIANMMDFDQHFGCKIGSSMNPIHKCNLLTA